MRRLIGLATVLTGSICGYLAFEAAIANAEEIHALPAIVQAPAQQGDHTSTGQARTPNQDQGKLASDHGLRQGPQQSDEHQKMISDCLRECRECARICNRASWHAYRQARSNSQMRHVQQLAGDCQAFCDLSKRMMERKSPLMGDSCGACERACTQCAETCEKVGGQDQEIAACAKKCRECAQTCHKMAAMHGNHAEHAGHGG